MRELLPGQAYTVIGTTVIDGDEYVVLRNPWGESKEEQQEKSLVSTKNIES